VGSTTGVGGKRKPVKEKMAILAVLVSCDKTRKLVLHCVNGLSEGETIGKSEKERPPLNHIRKGGKSPT